MTLFRGSMTDSLVRLWSLGEMGRRGQAPEWTFAELRQTFAYLTPAPSKVPYVACAWVVCCAMMPLKAPMF